MLKQYSFILMDCDGTLFDFDQAEDQALRGVFREMKLEYRPEYGLVYHQINAACWKALERGELTKSQLQKKRFQDFAEYIGKEFPAEKVGERYIDLLGEGSFLLPGAIEVCQELYKTKKIYLITNGIERTQVKRLNRSEIKKYIVDMFVSDAVGAAKPDEKYFQYVFDHIPDFHKEEALVVGDSLTSDILGGIRAGVDTCWVNASKESRPVGWDITYEIENITELLPIVEG